MKGQAAGTRIAKWVASQPGYEVSKDGKGHYRVHGPNGERTQFSCSPNGRHHTWQNIRSKLRRIGMDVPRGI